MLRLLVHYFSALVAPVTHYTPGLPLHQTSVQPSLHGCMGQPLASLRVSSIYLIVEFFCVCPPRLHALALAVPEGSVPSSVPSHLFDCRVFLPHTGRGHPRPHRGRPRPRERGGGNILASAWQLRWRGGTHHCPVVLADPRWPPSSAAAFVAAFATKAASWRWRPRPRRGRSRRRPCRRPRRRRPRRRRPRRRARPHRRAFVAAAFNAAFRGSGGRSRAVRRRRPRRRRPRRRSRRRWPHESGASKVATMLVRRAGEGLPSPSVAAASI